MTTETIERAHATEQASVHVVRDFVWETKHKNGVEATGWRPVLIPQFDPGVSYHVAHDTLEHIDPTDASLDAEMKAFGASLFMRGEGYWKKKFSEAIADNPLYELFSDVRTDPAIRLAKDFFTFLGEDKRALNAPPLGEPLPVKQEETIARLYHYRSKSKVNLSRASASGQNWVQRLDYAFGWMRVGYNAHKQLYGSLTQKQRDGMFFAIEKMVNKMTGPLYEYDSDLLTGSTLHVDIDVRQCRISAKILTKNGKIASQMHRQIS